MGSSAFESVSGKVDTDFLPFHKRLNQPIELACASDTRTGQRTTCNGANDRQRSGGNELACYGNPRF